MHPFRAAAGSAGQRVSGVLLAASVEHTFAPQTLVDPAVLAGGTRSRWQPPFVHRPAAVSHDQDTAA